MNTAQIYKTFNLQIQEYIIRLWFYLQPNYINQDLYIYNLNID